MKLKPLDDRVVVKPLEVEENTSGGIVLPHPTKEKSTKGEVIAVRSGKLLDNGKRLPISVKVGDKVLYGKYGGADVKVDGVEYKILSESEILAKID